VERAAYRVIQESLTNVARHSGADTATVTLSYTDGQLAVSVTDNGCARPDSPPVPGMGLLGMRERVTELGGRLTAAPGTGGFAVSATIPLATEVAA
jgi:signal transduction histidine kinase